MSDTRGTHNGSPRLRRIRASRKATEVDAFSHSATSSIVNAKAGGSKCVRWLRIFLMRRNCETSFAQLSSDRPVILPIHFSFSSFVDRVAAQDAQRQSATHALSSRI